MVTTDTAPQRVRPQQKKTRSRYLLIATGLVLLPVIAGCGGTVEQCEARYREAVRKRKPEHERKAALERAAKVCACAFEAHDAPAAAALSAAAAYELGRADEVHEWAARLRGQRGEAEVLFYVGLVQNDAGERDATIATHWRALDLARARDEPRAEARNAFALYWHASARGEYADALARAHEAFIAAQRSGEREWQFKAMEGLGLVLFHLGDLDGARFVQEQLRRIPDAGNEELQARLAQQEGVLYEANGRLELARDAFARSLEKAERAGVIRLQCSNRLNLAAVSIELNKREEARRHLAALELLDPAFFARNAPLYLGRLARHQERHDEAVAHLKEGLLGSNNSDWIWELEYELGEVHEQRGNAAEAAAAYERSVGVIEGMRSDLASNELRAWALARRRRPYEALFRLYARLGRARDALDVLERAKARSLLDAIIANTRTNGVATGDDATAGAEANVPPSFISRATARAGFIASLLPAMSAAPVARSGPIDEIVRTLAGRTALVYFFTADTRATDTRAADARDADARDANTLWLLRVDQGGVAV